MFVSVACKKYYQRVLVGVLSIGFSACPGICIELKNSPINEKIESSNQSQSPLDKRSVIHSVGLKENKFAAKELKELPGDLLTPIEIEKTPLIDDRSPGEVANDRASKINMVPLPLMASPEETVARLDKQREVEKEQLTALWEATLARSIDIDFVLTKLIPDQKKNRSTTVMMKMLSTLMYAGVGSLNVIAPGPGTRITQNLGVSLLSNLLNFRESKKDEMAHITQTEQILLFQMVRNLADNLVEKYRSYKKEWKSHIDARQDLKDLTAMVATASIGQSVADQIKMEYYLRRQRRDIEAVKNNMQLFRQALIDMAGTRAVLELEDKFEEEFKHLYPEVLEESGLP